MGKWYSHCIVLDLAGILIRVARGRRDIWLSLGMIAGVSHFSYVDLIIKLILSLLRSINSMAATRSTSLSSSQGFSYHYPQHFMVNHA
jgi:hypothetical protein